MPLWLNFNKHGVFLIVMDARVSHITVVQRSNNTSQKNVFKEINSIWDDLNIALARSSDRKVQQPASHLICAFLAFQFQSIGLNCIFLAWFVNGSLGGVLSARLLYLGVRRYFCHWRAHRVCPKTLPPALFSIPPPCPKIGLQGKWKSSWAGMESACQNGPRMPGNGAPGKKIAADLWGRRLSVEEEKLESELPTAEQMICERGNMTLSA